MHRVKVAILAGGFGTRLKEETLVRPKPMVEIGGRPILWHIMKIYSHYGFDDFIICLGYKGEIIKDYFLKYQQLSRDFTISIASGQIELYNSEDSQDWRVTLADTGLLTQTGGRLKRIQKYIGNETFMVTYGDGVTDLNIRELLRFHRQHGKIATITAVRPTSRFGELVIKGDNCVAEFCEKPLVSSGWINGGFFVFEPQVFNYLKDDTTYLEREPLENIAKDGQLVAFQHTGYWRCMDTLRDIEVLERDWEAGKSWKVW